MVRSLKTDIDMKKNCKNEDLKAAGAGGGRPHGEFDRLPRWLQQEYRVLASILKYPKKFPENKIDLEPDLFFDEQTFSIAKFIITYHREMLGGQTSQRSKVISEHNMARTTPS
jgi:hypothetical protein